MANAEETRERAPARERPQPAQPTAAERAQDALNAHDALDRKLDEALEMSFPASDPISIGSNDG